MTIAGDVNLIARVLPYLPGTLIGGTGIDVNQAGTAFNVSWNPIEAGFSAFGLSWGGAADAKTSLGLLSGVTNNTTSALTITTPNPTDATYDSNPIAALKITAPAAPTTRNFISGLWIQTQGNAIDKGRGIIINNLGASDGFYIQNDGPSGTGQAILLQTGNTSGTGLVIGTTVASQQGLVVRQEVAISATAAGTLATFEANGTATEMVRFNSTKDVTTGLIFRFSGANANPIVIRNAADSANALQLNNTGGVLSADYLLSNSPSSGVGYFTGAGGTVTQATSRTTGVTLNKITGAITLFSEVTPPLNTIRTFTLTNSAVSATDTVIVNVKSASNTYASYVTAVAAGSFAVTVQNIVGTATDSPVLNFAIIKGITT